MFVSQNPFTTITHSQAVVSKIDDQNLQLLLGETQISDDLFLNFAVVKVNGSEKLLPVINDRYYSKFRIYDGSPLEAVFKLAQHNAPRIMIRPDRFYGSPISYCLNHEKNFIFKEDELFQFLFEKDHTGTPRFCSLNAESTLDILQIIKEKKLQFNLNDPTPQGETLLSLWAGTKNIRITQLILELMPSAVKCSQSSSFIKAVLSSSPKEAQLIRSAMEMTGCIFTAEEVWFNTVLQNDCTFNEEEFLQLNSNLKLKLFFVANALGHFEMTKKLKLLGMGSSPRFIPGPSILAHNMDIVSTKQTIGDFLKHLRQMGLLMTAKEFQQYDSNLYIKKLRDPIGRIQGKMFIESFIQNYGFKYIKVPRKIAVIQDELKTVPFSIGKNLRLIPRTKQLELYAEKIEPVNRLLTLEEALEYMIILEKTGYSDFHKDNFIVAKDGTYFIDTEYKDFAPFSPSFNCIKTLKYQLQSQDVKPFLSEVQKRFENFKKEMPAREMQQNDNEHFFETSFVNLSNGHALDFIFTFDLDFLEC